MFSTGSHPWAKLLLVVIIIALPVYGAWRYFAPPTQNVESLTFTTAKQGNIEKSIIATGQLEPKHYVVVGAQVSGQVEKIHVEEGDVVEEGAVLVDIDATVFETQVQNAEAALESMRAQLAQLEAERELAILREKRNNNLFEQNAVSEDVAISSRIDVKVLDSRIKASSAQIRSNEASLAGDKVTLGFARIYAPISGTIASIAVRQGQTLNANQNAPELLQISDLTTMTLRAEVSEADVESIYRGMPVYFSTIGNTKKRYHSTVRQVLPTPTIINDVVLYQVLIDVENPDGVLMDSMTTQVFFIEDKAKDTLVVPLGAVKGPPDRKFVMVRKNNNLERRQVSVGISTRTEVQILSGLSEGEEIVSGQMSAGSTDESGPRGFGGPPRMPRG